MSNSSPIPTPSSSQHVVELLPAYLNGTLDTLTNTMVEQHISDCGSCQHECDVWKTIQQATIFAVEESMPLPSVTVLDNIFMEIAGEKDEQHVYSSSSSRQTLAKLLSHCWLVFKGQIAVLHKSIWSASALIMGLACILLLSRTTSTSTASILLTLFTSVIGTSGTAFIYGPQSDTGYELLLSTPTSPRLVMFSRMALVLGYDIALALLVSIVLVVARGEHLAQLVQLWLGPLLLLSSLSLLISLFFGSIIALCSSLTLVVAQTFQFGTDGISLVHTMWWQTNPILLLLSVLLVIIALYYGPRRVQLI